MTLRQLYLFNSFYFILLVAVVILTRASLRRLAGAIAGTISAGAAAIAVIAICERVGWWHFTMYWEPYYLFQIGISITLGAFVFLLTWRLARRFGGRGLAIALVLAALLGPFRDSTYMTMFPEWGYYAPAIAPMIAISGAYALIMKGRPASNRKIERCTSAALRQFGRAWVAGHAILSQSGAVH